MAFGTVIATAVMKGMFVRHGARGRRGGAMRFYCDGGARPNPGRSEPVVHDGKKFLRVPKRSSPGTNHRSVYDAVEYALQQACLARARSVVVEMPSYLVFRQLSTGKYCKHPVLAARQAVCLRLANKIPSVTWVRVVGPFNVHGSTLDTPRKVRLRARRLAGLRGYQSSGMKRTPNSRTPGSTTGRATVSTQVPGP